MQAFMQFIFICKQKTPFICEENLLLIKDIHAILKKIFFMIRFISVVLQKQK